MTDNVIASALNFAARAIEKAKANRGSCEAEIREPLVPSDMCAKPCGGKATTEELSSTWQTQRMT